MKKVMTLLCVLTCIIAMTQLVISSDQSKNALNVTKERAKGATKVDPKADTPYPNLWVLGELGIPLEDGTEEQVGYRPDKGIKMETSDGNIYTATVHFFNLIGDPVHNFGLCSATNLATTPADWDAINNYRIGAFEPETMIVLNKKMKIGEVKVSKENFFKIATGTYIVTVNLVEGTIVCVPTTDYTHVYLMGNGIKDQVNAANVGTELETTDGITFKQQIEFAASSDNGKATFSFSTKLGADANDWNSIAANRFGATEANTDVVLKQEFALGAFNDSKDNNFLIPSGIYEITINIETMTMKMTSRTYPPIYVLGNIVGQKWAANQGTAMETKDGNLYTLTALFAKQEDRLEATFAFSTKIAGTIDWEQIANYRFGYVESFGKNGFPVLYGKKMQLGETGPASKENFFGVQDGEYTITVDLAKRTCQVIPVGIEYDNLYVMGNTSSINNDGQKEYQVWAANQGTPIYTHDFKNYSGEITFEDNIGSSKLGFGFTTKLGADFTKWEEIANSRFGAQVSDYNVVLDQSIQCGELFVSRENKFSIPTGTYILNIDLPNRTMLISKKPFTSLYILGNVAYDKEGTMVYQPWSSKQGYLLSTDDGETYTGIVTVEDDLGSTYSGIGFTTKLSAGENEWAAITDKRFGAQTTGGEYLPYNTEVKCGEYRTSAENKFTVRRGEYKFTINLPTRSVKIEPTSEPVLYLIGTTEGKEFVANDGIVLSTVDGKTYIAPEVTFVGDEAQFVLSDKLASSEDGWSDIEKYTSGPEVDQTLVEDKIPAPVGKFANAWVTSPNVYRVTVDLFNKTILLNTDLSSVNTNKVASDIKVYPNPTTGIINIEGGKTINKIEVFNALNQLVDNLNNIDSNIVALDITSQATGFYFIRVNGETTVKVIKR